MLTGQTSTLVAVLTPTYLFVDSCLTCVRATGSEAAGATSDRKGAA